MIIDIANQLYFEQLETERKAGASFQVKKEGVQ